mmetsp:Transcript_7674/g.17544  ORF Transcript_7674/g.17544 Transcript_7674/m.17544 type:complete len:228 (-) Transcript_7674:174-857(-)
MLAFKAGCINVDIQGIEDETGATTEPGALFALEASSSEPLGPHEPARLFFLQHDGAKRFPFRDRRFEWIIAEHFIEHVSFAEAQAFLAEARRLLAPGGTLRISTPDLAIYAAAYFDPAQRFFKEHYELMTEGPRMEGNKAFMSSRPADMFNQIFYGYGHRHIYDERELREVSARAGWTEANGCSVVRAGFRESAMGDEALAALDDAVHKDESIYMEMFCERTLPRIS